MEQKHLLKRSGIKVEMTLEEVAKELEIPVRTVHYHETRAMAKIAKIFRAKNIKFNDLLD